MPATIPIFSILGLAVLLFRLAPSLFRRHERVTAELETAKSDTPLALTSIIIPARNEAANLPTLLQSLMKLEQVRFEVIVVDDNSTDETPVIVTEFASRDPRLTLLRGSPRPEGWSGKTWACEQGAANAQGGWLLFTDADTEHSPQSLALTLEQMRNEKLDMLSATPYHETATWFDPLMGPFHIMVLIGSSAFSKPSPDRVFAIGQYLLFKRDSYFRQGTHTAVKESFCEDLELAQACLARGGRYALNQSGQVFCVKMYGSLPEFIAGWRRIFRLGFGHSSMTAALEIFVVVACVFESFRFSSATPLEGGLALGSLLIFGSTQKKFGQFSWVGMLTAPFSIAVFIVVSGLALYDRVFGRDLRWRGRSYKI